MNPEKALSELLASPLFEPDFPKRPQVDVYQFARLSKSECNDLHDPSLEAIERDDVVGAEGLIAELDRAKYAPAVPALVQIWHNCAHWPIWTATGHALFEIGTEAAWSALESGLEDHDDFARFMALKVIFMRAPEKSYDLLAYRFAQKNERLVPDGILSFLLNDHEHRKLIFNSDPRWLELFVRLRRDENYGPGIRQVLCHFDSPLRDAAIARAMDAEAKVPAPPVRTHRDGVLLSRYRAGETEAVWRDIRAHGNIDGEFREEVLEVADAVMTRVAQNADLISERLRACGWRVLLSDMTDLRTAPQDSDAHVFSQIEEITGALIPPTLLSFWRNVGGINWVWDYELDDPTPDLGLDIKIVEMDPLCINPPGVLTYLFEEWIDQKRHIIKGLEEPFQIELAADVYHKANYSGGGPYGILIPFHGADPLFDGEEHNLPFIDYLRLAFRWAGFPGLEDHADREDVQRFVTEFTKDLVPF